MGNGPLDHPRLLAIDEQLDQGRLDEAQQLLAELGDIGFFRYATTYLATRLLYQRGRLDAASVAVRLRELLTKVDYFPEARAMLEAAEAGTLDPTQSFKHTAREPSVPSASGRRSASEPAIELGRAQSEHGEWLDPPTPPPEPAPSIPKAGKLPAFAASDEARSLPDFPDLDLPPSSRAPGSRPHTEAPEVTIRSGPPPAVLETEPRTLFEIAALLEAGKPELVLEELSRAEHGGTPEVVLMQARAFAQLGCEKECDDLLTRLGSAPLLEPEMRANVARLLIERGRPHEALTQAKHAHSDDPKPAIVRLTLAWAAIRALAEGGDPALATLAEKLLARLKARGHRPALVLALRARVVAASGDSERAISLARRALDLDPKNADALAALAIASARLARKDEAHDAWQRLCVASAAQAAVIAPVVSALGVEIGKASG